MQRLSGIHFYISIVNYNQIILDEEKRTNNVIHSIHALDTFFTSIESFGKKQSDSFVVEKITGSRLHLYVVDDILHAYRMVKSVSAYAYQLSKYINTEIPKYRSLLNFTINVGVAYGNFYNFEFKPEDGYSETTTIGYAANFAAKLQALTGSNKISISEDIYDSLLDYEKNDYEQVYEPSIKKYGQDKFYTASLASISSHIAIPDSYMHAAKDYANSVNLGDIDFSGVRALLNFHNLNKTQCKKLDGIPVFADIRGFTCQFDENDTNLDEMATKTQQILESMYIISTGHGGVHVQFQGDRELSLYHNIPAQTNKDPEKKCFKTAVLAAIRMIDAVKPYAVHIGVGESFGRLFATKIGARGEKDNILLGETVIHADMMEDKYAGEDQVAITEEVYEGLKSEDASLAEYFKKAGACYVATIGYQEYLRNAAYRQQSTNTSRNNYNGAWEAMK